MRLDQLDGATALITGGAKGIGAGVAREIARRGAHVVIADIDDTGAEVADEISGRFIRTDVREPSESHAAVQLCLSTFGSLELCFLNAGITTGTSPGPDFDLAAYRRAMGVNLDGVVFGINAALGPMLAAGAGTIIATASLAGLVALPGDAIYTANKHAVVGLVRSLGLELASRSIHLNALCPTFADTAIIEPIRQTIADLGFGLLEVDDVVAGFLGVLDAEVFGECWYVQIGRSAEAFQFRHPPGPR